MGKPITTGRIRAIEKLFVKYPEIPQEIVIKQDLLRLGERFSESAIAAAAGAEIKSYRLFSRDHIPMSSMQQQEYSKVPQNFFIKGGPYRLRPVMVRTGIAANSPYVIDVIDGHIKLLMDGAAIADVGYRPPLKYSSKAFPDGTAYKDIIANSYTIVPFRFCQFWGEGEECKFCDINENARQVKKFKADTLTAPVKPVEQVAEVANEIAREVLEKEGYPAPIRFLVTGGTITSKLNGLKEDEFYLRYVTAVKWGGPRRYVQLQTNAADEVTLKEYHQRGVDIYSCNLEVWDKHLFEWVCPGKSKRVGWEEWVKRAAKAVDIFGEGNVKCAFVCGVEMAQPHGFKTIAEAVSSTTEGFKFLMSHGVSPHFNLWIREARTYLLKECEQPQVPAEYYLQLVQNYYETWKRYEMPLPHLISAKPEDRVMGRDQTIEDDYLLLMEQKDYENHALQALEKAGAIWSYEV